MLIMSARDAKNSFGEALDIVQREPVLITRNNKPVSLMISLEDIKGTYLEDLFLTKQDGYDEWAKNKVSASMQRLETEGSKGKTADEVHNSIMEKVRQKLNNKIR